jgi:hypothetical protein
VSTAAESSSTMSVDIALNTMEVISDHNKSSLNSVIRDKVKLQWTKKGIGRREFQYFVTMGQ